MPLRWSSSCWKQRALVPVNFLVTLAPRGFWYDTRISIGGDCYETGFEAGSPVGTWNSDLGEFKKAIKYFENAIRINPHYKEVLINLGRAYYDLKKYNHNHH